MRWLVTVAGQTSDLSAAATRYGTPTLTGLSRDEVSTRGGARVELNGTDLGLSLAGAYLEVLLTTNPNPLP